MSTKKNAHYTAACDLLLALVQNGLVVVPGRDVSGNELDPEAAAVIADKILEDIRLSLNQAILNVSACL